MSPVGFKFLFEKPEKIERTQKTLAFCEMLKEAHQKGTPFYFDVNNLNCGKQNLGMEERHPAMVSGQLGVRLGIFQEPRINASIYQQLVYFNRGSVNHVVLSPLDKLTFEPDLVMFTATPGQAGIILRAMSYSTAEPWVSTATPISGCTWLYIYPILAGKVNYVPTGMLFGMTTRHVFPEGLMLVAVPRLWIPTITQNLVEMEWIPTAYTEGREQYLARKSKIVEEIIQGASHPQ